MQRNSYLSLKTCCLSLKLRYSVLFDYLCSMKLFRSIIIESSYPAIGAMLLLGLLRPFGLDQYEHGILIPCLGVGLFSFVVTFSMLAFNAYILRLNLDNTQPLTKYLRNILIKHAINICLLSVPLVFFASWVWHRDWTYWWFDQNGNFTVISYFECLVQVSLIGFFIIIWDLYQYKNKQLKAELEDVRIINGLLEEHQLSFLPSEVTLVGQAGKSVLTFRPDDLIYIESVANYAYLYYMNEGKICNTTLRLTLRSICETLQHYQMLTQCHRAFLVNLNYIESLHTTSTSSYVLSIFGVDKEIPVSRKFLPEVKKKLQMR